MDILSEMWMPLAGFVCGAAAVWIGMKLREKRKKTAPISADASALIQHAATQDSFFNMVLGMIPCQVFIKDPQDGYKYKIANRNFTEYYQLDVKDVLEHPDEDIFEPEVAKQLRHHDKEVISTPGKVFRYDEDISFRRNGKEVFKSLKVCFETSDGHPYLLGVCVDVTELARNTNRLQKTQDLLNLVINTLPMHLFAKDADNGFRYTIANRNFAEFVGMKLEDVIGKTDGELPFHPDDSARFTAQDIEVMRTGKRVNEVEHPVDCHGVTHHQQTLKLATTGPDGNRLLLGISLDITDLNNMIQMERISNEALTQAVAETDFHKVVERIGKTLHEEMNCSRVFFLTYGEKTGMKLFCEIHSDHMESVLVHGIQEQEEMWNRLYPQMEANQQMVYERLSQGGEELDEFLREYPEHAQCALCMTPVMIGKTLVGALMITYDGPHVFLKTERELLRSMGKIVSLAAIRDRQSSSMRQAEEENQSLLDNISIPLWLYDLSGHIIQTNKAADRLFGFPTKQTAFSCKELLGCELKGLPCPVQNVLESGRMDHERYKIRGRSYLVESNPIREPQTGCLHGVVSSFFDVTELEESIANREIVNECLINLVRENDMQQAMQKSIRRICEQLGASRCYIVHFNTDEGTVSCFLEHAQNGDSILSWIQKRPYDRSAKWEERFRTDPLLCFPNQESLMSEDGLASYRKGFEKYEAESVYAHRIMLNGKIWGYLGAMYEHRAHELTSTEQNFIGSIAYCIELMLIRRRYQSKIFEALRQAESADKAKSIFLASMSHEIRTPLNAVIGFSELLKDGTMPRKTELDYLNAISNAGNALLALINDVLDLSKLEAGQMVFSPTEVDFSDLVREVASIFQQKCQEKKLELRTDFNGEMPRVCIDKLRLRQILFNLVGNAVKFTDAGWITVAAHFEPEADQRGVLRFSVSDTGIGISEEDQKQIFQMFVQARAVRGTQAEQNGTGLGLAICKRMIEKMNGKLLLKSALGKGSEFTVELSGVQWIQSGAAEEKHNVYGLASGAEQATERSHRILVADDVEMNLKVMNALLTKLGQTVLLARNGDNALEVLEREQVDYLLTDLWMPGMNGAELAEKIRHSGKYPRLVIAAVTADVDGGENFDMSGFDAVLTKPVTIAKLAGFIRQQEERQAD